MGKSKSKPIQKEIENEDLVIALRSGDTSVINTIISNHINLAYSVAFAYLSYSKGDINNLISASLFGLVYGTHRARIMLVDNNITPYLVMHMHKMIYNEIIELSKNCLASTSLYKKKRKQPDFVMGKFVQLKTNLKFKSFSDIDLKDEITSIALDDIDFNILNLKIQGFNRQEIAEKLSINVKTVTRRQQDIQRRWNEKCST